MAKLALLVGTSAPLLLLSASAMAAGQAPPPAAPPPAAAAPTAPAQTVAPAAPPAAAAPPPAATVVVAPPATTVVAVVPTVAASAPSADGTVEVHIATKELVTLERRTGPSGAWQTVCQTPCDTRVPGGDEFRIVGEGINDSEPFSLTTPKGDVVKIHVAPGLKKRAKIGEYMTFTGAVVFVGALVVGIGAANPGSTFQANGSTNNYNWDVIAVGTAVGVVGAVSAILGGAWWYDNSTTKVAGDVQGEQPTRGGLEPRYQTGLRLSAPNIPTYSAPIFTATF